MIVITDTVECGYFDDDEKGGTIEVSVILSGRFYKKVSKPILNIIDKLDHCILTDDEEISKVSKRYFLLEEKTNFLNDVAVCLAQMFNDEEVFENILGVTIKLGKVQLKLKYSELLSMNKDRKVYYDSED